MDLQQLKIFLSVAAHKSFSRAAEALFLSQPTVSARIKGLEEELGTVLFDRSRPREAVLTRAGMLFMDYAQRLVNLEAEALEKVAGRSGQAAEMVRIGASTVPGLYLLPSWLAEARPLFPALEITLAVLDSSEVVENLLNYSFELGFVGSASRREQLSWHPVAEDELILAAPPGLFSPRKKGGTVSLEQCLEHNLLLREKGSATRQLLEQALKERGLTFDAFPSRTLINSLEGIKQGVRFGLGISFISRRSAEDYLNMGLLEGYRVAGMELRRTLYLVYHRRRVLSTGVQRLLDYFLGKIRDRSH
ncbi:MAG: selenium metabolism-associated LysR family transcriptional regulator [Dethiobacteria bacterium]|jgi:DNA-binding transcriptional LysR family regulator